VENLCLSVAMLSFQSIHYAYDEKSALTDLSFEATPGEITCVVGPSGCGKSTLLGLAAGLLEMQAGEIRLDGMLLGKRGFNLPPEQRPVGLVFQEGALFPHMTVAQNTGFGVSGDRRNARVAELLDLVGLSAEAQRYPHTLSGGQRQRVALARALAPEPRALLFDEPYANLDQALRRSLRIEARDMVRQSGTIGIFVTHDPDDVMALADQVVLLGDGRVLQAGTPRALFDQPRTAQVATLFGQAQSIDAVLAGNKLQTAFGSWSLESISRHSDVSRLQVGTQLRLSVRPDSLELRRDDAGRVILELRIAGADDVLEIDDGHGGRLFARLARPHDLVPGCRVRVEPRVGSVFLFTA
jgi:iron(III) transport system ATP-binding protein